MELVKSQTALTDYSRGLNLATLSEVEKKMLEKKYQSPTISQMSDVQILIEAERLVLKIYVITGWVVPVKAMTDILIEQFYEMLKESYGSLNIHEIEYAFRKNVGIQDWGKEMNLELLNKVLDSYLDKRLDVSATEEKLKTAPPEQRIYTDEEIDNQRREEIELGYQAMKRGRIIPVKHYWEDLLKKDGLLKEENASEFFVRCLNNQVENIYKKEN